MSSLKKIICRTSFGVSQMKSGVSQIIYLLRPTCSQKMERVSCNGTIKNTDIVKNYLKHQHRIYALNSNKQRLSLHFASILSIISISISHICKRFDALKILGWKLGLWQQLIKTSLLSPLSSLSSQSGPAWMWGCNSRIQERRTCHISTK